MAGAGQAGLLYCLVFFSSIASFPSAGVSPDLLSHRPKPIENLASVLLVMQGRGERRDPIAADHGQGRAQ
jgi:hypothetical protein